MASQRARGSSAGLARGASWSLLGTGTDYLVSLLLALALGKHFGPVVYGLWPLAVGILELPRALGGVALGTSLVRSIAQTRPEEYIDVAGLARAGAVLMLGTGAVLGMAIAIFSSTLAALFGRPELIPMLQLGAVVVIGGSALWYVQAVLQGRRRIAVLAQSQMVSSVVRLAVTLLAVFVAGGSIASAVIGLAAGYIVAAAIYAWLGLRGLRLQSGRASSKQYRDLIRYTLPLMVTWLAYFLAGRMDFILLGAISDDKADVGYLAMAASFAMAPYIVVQALGTAISPSVTRAWAFSDVPTLEAVYSRAHRAVALIYVPISAGMILLIGPLIAMILPSYQPCSLLVQIMCAGMLLRAVGALCSGGILTPGGFAKEVAWLAAFSAAGNVMLDIALIPTLGALGSAIGTTFVFGANGIAAFIIVGKRMRLTIGLAGVYTLPLLATLAASLATGAVLLSRAVNDPGRFAAAALAGAIVYCSVVYAADQEVRRHVHRLGLAIAQALWSKP